MRTVTVNKAKLIETVKENREAHRDIFLEAQKGYRKQAIELLDESLRCARNGKKFKMMFSLPAPVDQTEEYDKALKMLEWSVDDNIELGEQAFRQYVLDDWSWSMAFSTTNSRYTATEFAK